MRIDLPAPARDVAAQLGVRRPVAVSFDVHQHSWEMREAGERLFDPHNERIATHPITLDGREVRVELAGRPRGPLPAVVSGASPAYDLLSCDAEVVAIEPRR